MIKEIKIIDIGAIINFLYHKYDKTKDIVLLFNIGVVIFIWGEKELGKKELTVFIKKVRRDSEYKVLVDKSLQLLKE